MTPSPSASTYAAAGVDLDAADTAVDLIRPHVERTTRAEVLGGIGGFGGLFALDPGKWRAPVMVTATDGVGTKLELARRLGRHDTIGRDLVAMVVDDLVVPGAEPLVFLDYVAVGKLDPATVEEIVRGVADGCVEAGCALVGGEMAEHPGTMAADAYDLAGFGVGIVERDALLGPQRVREGDAIVAMASSGLHSNGYSLVRTIVDRLPAGAFEQPLTAFLNDPESAQSTGSSRDADTLGEALLRPTRIYARDCLRLIQATEVHALCHITGGGVPGNLPRVLPPGMGARVDTDTFPVPDVIRAVCQLGAIPVAEQWRVFNMGAGMLAAVADGDAAIAVLRDLGVDAWVAGEVTPTPGVYLTKLA